MPPTPSRACHTHPAPSIALAMPLLAASAQSLHGGRAVRDGADLLVTDGRVLYRLQGAAQQDGRGEGRGVGGE